eukprot:evm.model.scf_415.2 EVM.evm.TU.scf_415.2   scf_415:13869-23272(+)
MTEHTGSSPLFAVFSLSILSLILIPWTIYKLCSKGQENVQPWVPGGKKRTVGQKLAQYFTIGNVALVFLWIVAAVLVVYVQKSQKDMAPFDPYEILGIQPGIPERAIKKAFRELTLKCHPDKNPKGIGCAHNFVDIVRAHRALTDPESMKKYQETGNPDGFTGGLTIGIALPEWLLPKDKKVAPVALLLLVCSFILVPLGGMACYLFRSDKYTGPNNIIQETIGRYWQCIRQGMSVGRIPEILVLANEFIHMHTPRDQLEALVELRQIVSRYHKELLNKPLFKKRKTGVQKAHMLLLAHLEREGENLPEVLKNDSNFVLERTPVLLEEIVKMACWPRPPRGRGWLAPAVGAIQLVQCVTQAVPTCHRKTTHKGPGDGVAALLQLPGMKTDMLKLLSRKKVRSLHDLVDLYPDERSTLLSSIGFNEATIQQVETALLAMPQVHVTAAEFFVVGEEDIVQKDVVTCKVNLVLTRGNHCEGDVTEEDLKASAVHAYCTVYPHPRPEKWYLLLADQDNNEVFAQTHVNLAEAERLGFIHGEQLEQDGRRGIENGRQSGQIIALRNEENEMVGQAVELRFPALKEGRNEFQLMCMSDCWIGCDKTVNLRMTVKKLKKERNPVPRAQQTQPSDDEDKGDQEDDERSKGSDAPDDSDAGEDEEGEEGEDEWDSDESGELESAPEGEDDDEEGADEDEGEGDQS